MEEEKIDKSLKTLNKPSRNRVNAGLERYYKRKGVKYPCQDGIGKFIEFCDDNGFDSDLIGEELENAEDTILGTFDSDNFPTQKTGKDKETEIIRVIEQCWIYPDAFRTSLRVDRSHRFKPVSVDFIEKVESFQRLTGPYHNHPKQFESNDQRIAYWRGDRKQREKIREQLEYGE